MTKKFLAALLAAAAATAGVAAVAAPAPEAAPAPAPAPKLISLEAAVAAAEKSADAEAVRAGIRAMRGYGAVWDVRMRDEGGARIRTLVDAETGEVLATDRREIRGAGMGHHRPHHAAGWRMNDRAGHPQHPHGFGPRPDCPVRGL